MKVSQTQSSTARKTAELSAAEFIALLNKADAKIPEGSSLALSTSGSVLKLGGNILVSWSEDGKKTPTTKPSS